MGYLPNNLGLPDTVRASITFAAPAGMLRCLSRQFLDPGAGSEAGADAAGGAGRGAARAEGSAAEEAGWGSVGAVTVPYNEFDQVAWSARNCKLWQTNIGTVMLAARTYSPTSGLPPTWASTTRIPHWQAA